MFRLFGISKPTVILPSPEAEQKQQEMDERIYEASKPFYFKGTDEECELAWLKFMDDGNPNETVYVSEPGMDKQ